MNFSRLSILVHLALVVLICGPLLFFGGDIPSEDTSSSPNEVVIFLDGLNGDIPLDFGVSDVNASRPLNHQSQWASLEFGYVAQHAILELRATGPPSA